MTVEGQTTGTEPTAQQLWDQELAAAVDNTPAAATPEPDAQTAAAPSPAASPAATPAPTPAPAVPADDPFAGLHPAVRARLESIDALTSRLRNAEGHIGGLTSENKRIANELAVAKAAAVSATVAPTATQMAAAKINSEKWDQLKTEFPEWAEALEERLSGLNTTQPDIEALRTQIREDLKQEMSTDVNTRIADITAKTEDRLVNVAHRGWKDLVKTKDFTDWYAKQPTEVQQLGASPVAEDAIALLDRFQAQRPVTQVVDPVAIKQQRQQRLQEAAQLVRGNGNSEPVKSTDDMSAKELWDYEANLAEQTRKKQQRR